MLSALVCGKIGHSRGLYDIVACVLGLPRYCCRHDYVHHLDDTVTRWVLFANINWEAQVHTHTRDWEFRGTSLLLEQF